MNFVILILSIYGAIALISILLYIPKLIQFAHAFTKPPHYVATERRKLALVIPARNESEVIGALFTSIATQTYDNFDVNVIVKSADDPTIALSKQLGYNVFVIPDQTCKGDALDGYFHALGQDRLNDYDAYIIVDADAVLDDRFLEEMNNALEQGRQVYVGRKFIKNNLSEDRCARSIFSSCAALAYPLNDDWGNIYRMKKGTPLNFCGQGMMIRSDVIAELGGWPYRTLTEDYEMKLDSFVKGYTSAYVPEAIVYTEEVIKHRDCWTRRLRWLMGYQQSDHKYKKAIRQKCKEGKLSFFARYDCFFGIAPIILFIVASLLTALFGAGLTIYYACVGNKLWISSLLLLTVLPIAVMYLIEFGFTCATLIVYREALEQLSVGEKIAIAFFNPLFTFEYFPIFIHAYFSLVFKKNLTWKPTKRIKMGHSLPVSLQKIKQYARSRRERKKSSCDEVRAEE